MLWRCRQRCHDERLRCGMVACRAYKQVIERQQCMATKGHDDGLVLDRQHGRFRIFRTGWQVCHRVALLPLSDSLLVDAVVLGQRPQALLTMLYRSTDCRCRRGAAMENLAHSASFHSCVKNAPANPGIK